MAIIPQFFIDAVVSIGIQTKISTTWIGTGFLATRKVDSEGNAIPMLITNRHVVENQSMIILRFTDRTDGSLKEVPASLIENEKPLYKTHPDSNVDIAVLQLNAGFITENNFDFPAFDIDEHAMSSSDLRSKGVDEGSLVYMLGYPMGLVNVSSKLPICRLGCVARMSEAQIHEAKNILVDIQNFPGNSGSPIITRPEFISIEDTPVFGASTLLGIVHAYIPYREQLVNQQTEEIVEIRSENSGLAWVHPVEQIREVVDLITPKFKLVEAAENGNE